ncbi:CvfD/Ygs/GSP13 family RNA-binding post-transcriptional regulator [Dellaglioa sp. P0083]|uniref:CvfD/Ygs/GSP13 family RNA-binding post-transcriptional regulator n=1 Tax=Dellaglioa kimchii TaxID=3344667 RepID=UPI0038D4F183
MKYRIGQIIVGTITGIQPYGAFVTIADGVQGLIHISECHNGYVDNILNYLKINEKIKVRIIDIDEYNSKMSFSIRNFTKQNSNPKSTGIKIKHKYYWTNRTVDTGFKAIDDKMDFWISQQLRDIHRNRLDQENES